MNNVPVEHPDLRSMIQLVMPMADSEMPTLSDVAIIAAFQQKHGLPETGTMDKITYSALSKEYHHFKELAGAAEPCVSSYPATLTISTGQSHPHVLLTQAMLYALRQEFGELPAVTVHGTLDHTTEQCLKIIQHCSDLPETGHLDKQTWNRLSRLYRAVYDRYLAPSQG